MDLEYDRKFEEMKMYIPFLESMIKRLESTSTAATNPRQAQLDKIRSLRDLLLDKKKRMKMENLLKCEQVLVNLYAKVEQRDALPTKSTPNIKKNEDKDLEVVRNKLKSITTKTTQDNKETLPEISRASEIEEVCTPGSKEPALFQRRPNKASISPFRSVQSSPNKSASQSASKRNYTRVLVSPEPSSRRWDEDEKVKEDVALFSRRSPKRQSPARERKKERKKSSKAEKVKKAKGLNITLSVPEDSLNSLNTKDILSRIMNCNDNDMDIETLREAKRQILSELEHTGAKYDDISDLLLKSYKKKSTDKKVEVEEGELSDSESEAIESIYGGLNSNQSTTSNDKKSDDQEQPRKIQICLVINPEDVKQSEASKVNKVPNKPLETDTTDFQMYDVKDSVASIIDKNDLNVKEDLEDNTEQTKTEAAEDKICDSNIETNAKPANFYKPIKEQPPEESNKTDEKKCLETKNYNQPSEDKIAVGTDNDVKIVSPLKDNTNPEPTSQEPIDSIANKKDVEIPLLHETVPTVEKPKNNVSEIDILQALKNEILSESLALPGSEAVTPALHQPKLTKVSCAQEIAPKKRISIEKYKENSVLQARTVSPLVVKECIMSTKDDLSKKQSLKLTMKECERFNFPVKLSIDDDDSSDEDSNKKSSVCSDDIYSDIAPKSPDLEESSDISCTPPVIIPEDPIKSSQMIVPSKEDVDMRTFPLLLPTAIPKPKASPSFRKDSTESNIETMNKTEPVKINIDRSKLPSDPRMRRDQNQSNKIESQFSLPMNPERGPQPGPPPHIFSNVNTSMGPNMSPSMGSNMTPGMGPNMTPGMGPNMTPGMGPNMTPCMGPNMTPGMGPNMTPTMAPNLTPGMAPNLTTSMAPNMTPTMTPVRNPGMTPIMTPNSRSFEIDESVTRKHVYTPMFTSFDARDRETSVAQDQRGYQPEIDVECRRNKWEPDPRDINAIRQWEERNHRQSSMQRDVRDFKHTKNSRFSIDRREMLNRPECPLTPSHHFGRADCPPTPNPYGLPGLLDTPVTPIHPFGRSDCPPTPSHPFGRTDCPTTPSHPFGRSECPSTPGHPFGRSECPSTPGHPFGRSECPTTPSHPFGRSDMLYQSFGRTDNAARDPRLNRSSDYDKYNKNDCDRNYYRDRNSTNVGYKPDVYNKSGDGSVSYEHHRERSVSRHDKHKYSSHDRNVHYNREPRRESSVARGGRAVSRDIDNERLYSRERNYGNYPRNEYYNRKENSRKSDDYAPRRGFYRERSIGRPAPEDRPYRSSSRAPSDGRVHRAEESDKKLSVKPDAGRSFTIDTSVNTTFQEFLNSGKTMQVFDYTFDSRRQRAASVGRSLARESSVGRTVTHTPKQTIENENSSRKDFRRASSVGRDIVGKERSFKDLKADFEKYKIQTNTKPENTSYDRKGDERYESGNRKSRKDTYVGNAECASKKTYSPKKNQRDPRLKREQSHGSKSKLDDRYRKDGGIVYSNDNITKGTILGSGYGVKNYKIPKIKRPVKEKEETADNVQPEKKVLELKTENQKKIVVTINETDRKEKGDKEIDPETKEVEKKTILEKSLPVKNKEEKMRMDKNKKNTVKMPKEVITSNKKSHQKPLLQNLDIVENIAKRVTRLSKKNEITEQRMTKGKFKKAVIYDSESDDENSQDSSIKSAQTQIKDNLSADLDDISADENTFDSQPAEPMDSSFGIEDIEMFSDNPVIDNINALIADLDNELGPAKTVTPTDFTNDDMIEDMLESITNVGKEDTKSLNEDEKLNDIAEVINNDLNESSTSLDLKHAGENNVIKSISNDTKDTNELQNVSENQVNSNLKSDMVINTTNSGNVQEAVIKKINESDDVVTTTDSQSLEQIESKIDQSDVDGRSTPDSTNNSSDSQHKLSQESVPDSTNEVLNESNSIVSSTHDPVEISNKDAESMNTEPSSSKKDSTLPMDSLGSILSLLQSKSKINELLSKLKDQMSDNDKMKKKLEKLSEIVSDEEDESKDNVVNTEEKKIDNSKEENDTQKVESISTDQTSMVSSNENESKNEGLNIIQNPEGRLSEEQSKVVEIGPKEKPDEVATDIETQEIPEPELETPELDVPASKPKPVKKMPVKKGRPGRKGKFKKNPPNPAKRITRSNIDPSKSKKKRQSRELKQLQESIKEMFMKDEILNATGIRMCRLAKLVDDKKEQKEESAPSTSAPVVVIEKVKEIEPREETLLEVRKGKKPKAKAKSKIAEPEKKLDKLKTPKYKPGPKSKTKLAQQSEDDPYEFESDSVSDIVNDDNEKSLEGKEDQSSGSESESLTSSKSFGSSEVQNDPKKKTKRKRSSWKTGVIKARGKKKKTENKSIDVPLNDDTLIPKEVITIPDFNCFTDKSYCFRKNVTTYSCRLCVFSGENIVAHYKEDHPHLEIPLSRMPPKIAREAIEQCQEINFQAIGKIPTDKYVCRFCYKEFVGKKCASESLFWHIVSMHTGEYKSTCPKCVTEVKCPFKLDIPPPKDVLIGFICGKCNFTQISLENLKTHVIVRHNDEQTEVYTINLAVLSKQQLAKMVNSLNPNNTPNTSEAPRVLRSTRSNQSMTEASDDVSECVTDSDNTSEPPFARVKRGRKPLPSLTSESSSTTPYQTKIAYENEDDISDISTRETDTTENVEKIVTKIKVEKDFCEEKQDDERTEKIEETPDIKPTLPIVDNKVTTTEETSTHVETQASDDIFAYPHFKIRYTNAGSKEYVCCINGLENHYKTNLLISMKKHVQMKHKEMWDGYCFVCKVIVTPQGHKIDFKECLQHFLDKHMDNFPVIEDVVEEPPITSVDPPALKPYINVRPLSQLISNYEPVAPPEAETLPILPRIESIVSLGAPTPEPCSSNKYPLATEPVESAVTPLKYEEAQEEVMSMKHQVVLHSMMSWDKLVSVFKCAGRFCSFTSDSAEDALLHASTHARVGGEGALRCTYCSFDCAGNAIDLVMHVFKSHGGCPFVCALCVYRAAAPQLVAAHAARAHPRRPAQVLAAAGAQPPAPHKMEPREAVVKYYVCPHACKYRTYTAPKFCEHLQQRHPAETSHPCYICQESFPSGAELVAHQSAHALALYQCAWCEHGAAAEPALLAHAAAAHPARPPQAYLRIITSKEGSKEFRVLPLASFNKTKVDVERVPPSGARDDPVRAAERCIDLETLIGGSKGTPAPVDQPMEVAADQEPILPPEECEDTPDDQPRPQTPPSQATPASQMTPPPMSIEDRSNLPTPKLKTETVELTPEKIPSDVVYCLDSDDDDSRTNASDRSVVHLSDEEKAGQAGSASTGYEKIPGNKLFKCPICKSVFKNLGGFKRHTQSCFHTLSAPVACPHCETVARDRDELLTHLTTDHGSASPAACGVCQARFYSIGHAKRHLKEAHKVVRMLVKGGGEGRPVEVVPLPAAGAKRKLSAGAPEPPAKRRYGPQDAHRLPINPILDESVHCALCEFNTKVRVNMVRHLQQHASQRPAPSTAPVNPVPHLASNEMHFDRMLNLAASSLSARPPAPGAPAPPAPAHAPYPAFVPARTRYACGACSYLSVDEELFQCHWTTLHAAADRYACVHCARVIPLEARAADFPKIMEHLQLHGADLYACAACPALHASRAAAATHAREQHAREPLAREPRTVREQRAGRATPPPAPAPAPTMDLKPWQCGLCEYRSMLRQEIVEHCGKAHQSKMQYKCPGCPFRTSTLENVTKHMTNSHPNRGGEVVYYFYREGTVADEDGLPKWRRQRQRAGLPELDGIKTEAPEPAPAPQPAPAQRPPAPAPMDVDLNLVKKEAREPSPEPMTTIQQLCEKYGQFCEPNGLNYKCPLCLVVMEDTREGMQSHLFEELRYRRWSCGKCSYRAFHSAGLAEHASAEHRGADAGARQLPPDQRVEAWVGALLDHQARGIAGNRDSLAKQKILTSRPSRPARPDPPPPAPPARAPPTPELERLFGPLGRAAGPRYRCPKCDQTFTDEPAMRDHLEAELTKIRWCCSHCAATFQTYHEAQFHCKSAHLPPAGGAPGPSAPGPSAPGPSAPGPSAPGAPAPAGPPRPREAERSPALRAAWLQAVIQIQKQSLASSPAAEAAPAPDNSLLVVRARVRSPSPPADPPGTPDAPGTPEEPDSDEERLVIAERRARCPHCAFVSAYPRALADHAYRHYGLKPYACALCGAQGHKAPLQHHVESVHQRPYLPELVIRTPMPTGPPLVKDLSRVPSEKGLRCLYCRAPAADAAALRAHTADQHPGQPPRPARAARRARPAHSRETGDDVQDLTPASDDH